MASERWARARSAESGERAGDGVPASHAARANTKDDRTSVECGRVGVVVLRGQCLDAITDL